MRILPIQTNYVNKINFKQNESNTVSSPMEDTQNNKFANKNTRKAVTVGLGALAVIGLVYAGYRGKLGAKIQKLLGGASDATKSVERNTPEVNGSVTKPSVKPDNADINPNSTTELADDIKIIGGEEPKKVFDGSDAEDVEFVEDIHKFLTPEEFKTLPREEVLKRFDKDLDEIVKKSEDIDDYNDAIADYIKIRNLDPSTNENADFYEIVLDKAENKFANDIVESGGLTGFKLMQAAIKSLVGKQEEAEQIVVEVLNKNSIINDNRLGVYITLKGIFEKSKTPEKYYEILNKAMEKDFKIANELQAGVREHLEKFGVRTEDLDDKNSVVYKFINSKNYFETLDVIYDDIAITDKNNPIRETIKSIVESNNEIEALITGKAAN